MQIKKKLAIQIVTELHDEKQAFDAQKTFEEQVQHKEIPDNIPTFKPANQPQAIIDVLLDSKLVESKAEAKRLLSQNAVTLDGAKITDPDFQIKEGILKVGKHKFLKIKKG